MAGVGATAIETGVEILPPPSPDQGRRFIMTTDDPWGLETDLRITWADDKPNGFDSVIAASPDMTKDTGMETLLKETGRDGPLSELTRLLKSDASPSERDGRVREKDAGSASSSAICATEDVLSRRPVRSEGRGFVFQQPPSGRR